TVTINPKELTVSSIAEASKEYDKTADFSDVDVLLTGKIGSDDVKATGKASVDSAEPNTYSSANVSEIVLTGADKNYYTIQTAVNGVCASLTIRKKPQPTTISDFVEQLYKTILGRGSDAAGHKTWVDGLTNKTISGASCVYSFAFGTEYVGQNTSDDDFITMLYAAFFGREPDAGGYKTWTKALENGMSREWVFTHFVSSPEFADTCKALGIEVGTYQTHDPRDEKLQVTAYVNRLYQTCLGRKGEARGINAWT
ncbi:MAG: DUF4214 domain-containing protein, partial [Ruthenibacterium sp.]